MRHRLAALAALALATAPAAAGPVVLVPDLHHLRAGAGREWADFPADAEGPRLAVTFRAARNAAEQTLRIRQQGVRQGWRVLLNGAELGRLLPDENDTELVLPVPPGRLADGDNALAVEPAGRGPGDAPDDVRGGEVTLDDRPPAAVLNEATVEVTVREEVRPGQLAPVPCRLTVLAARGCLATTGAASDGRRTSAYETARAAVAAAGADWRAAVRALSGYDEAVAAQAAGLLRAGGVSPSDAEVRGAAAAAGGAVLRGFDAYAEAWRAGQVARQESPRP